MGLDYRVISALSNMHLRVYCFQTQLTEISGIKSSCWFHTSPMHIWNYMQYIYYDQESLGRSPRVLGISWCGIICFGEFLHLTPSPGNLMYFLSPQCNSHCGSRNCLLLAKRCRLWHSTYFPLLRGIHFNTRLLVRINILCVQHTIPYIPRRRKYRSGWESREAVLFSTWLYNSLPSHFSSLCPRFTICKIPALNLLSCG